MDDLSQTLQGLLKDPSTLSQVQGLLQSLSGNAETAPQKPAPPPQKDEMASLLPTLQRLGPLLSCARQEDDTTRFLRALRPLLGEARQKKLDEALKLLNLLRMLPLLKGAGLFSGL